VRKFGNAVRPSVAGFRLGALIVLKCRKHRERMDEGLETDVPAEPGAWLRSPSGPGGG